jgi:hypothetical protein
MPSSFFQHVDQKRVQTSAGGCDLPILYRDASLLSLSYRIDPAKARSSLPAGLEPWVIFGKALALVCMFEYRDTTIGPYGEVGVGVLARRVGSRPSLIGAARDLSKVMDAGLYVVNLPVSEEVARAAGVELWGYPKYVTGIGTTFRPDGVRVTLDGDFELDIGPARGLRSEGLAIITFSVKGGRLIRTAIVARQPVRWGGARSVKLVLTGDGPTAKTMRALGLHTQTPAFACRTDQMQSILPLGVDVGDARGAG